MSSIFIDIFSSGFDFGQLSQVKTILEGEVQDLKGRKDSMK
jgi:hypothetical protein